MSSSNPLGDEKDWEAVDPVGVEANTPERHNPDAEIESDASPIDTDLEKHLHDEKQEIALEQEPLQRIRTEASQLTQITTRGDDVPPARKLTRWQRINPLKWNPRPVPTERIASREYTANIFSIISFQWMTPVMVVGKPRRLSCAMKY